MQPRSALILLLCGVLFGPALVQCKDASNQSKANDSEAERQALLSQHHQASLYEKHLTATFSVLAPDGSVRGSGFWIDGQGHAITCHHVLAGQKQVRLRQAGTQKTYSARLVTDSPAYDLALLLTDVGGPHSDDNKAAKKATAPSSTGTTADRRELPFVRVPQFANPKPGARFVAIGSPQGFAESLIPGSVSYSLRADADPSAPQRGFVQLSVPVLPGASGSPVLDMRGQLIGVMRFSVNAGVAGLGTGFAIPSNHVFQFLAAQTKIKLGRKEILRGIVPIPLTTPQLVAKLGLPTPLGVLVSYVEPDSPAAKAGIRRYDFITHAAGKPVQNETDLFYTLYALRGVVQVELQVFRSGRVENIFLPMEVPASD